MTNHSKTQGICRKSSLAKRIPKYFFILAIVFCCIFHLSACVFINSDTEEPPADTFETDNMADTSDENSEEVSDDNAKNDKQQELLSPEKAVEIYLQQKDKWMKNHDFYPLGGFGYALLDLDFDGVLELIQSTCEGTGRFSYNSYYRINPDTLTVESLSCETDFDEYDYFYAGTDNTKLFRNNEDGTLFYYCLDHCRISNVEYSEEFGKLYFKDDMIKIEKLHNKELAFIGSDDDGDGIYEGDFLATLYGLCTNREYTAASEDEYNQAISQFFAENTNMNLSWVCIEGNDFNTADEDKQKELLLNAYKSFSYDGFAYTDGS